MHPLKESNHKVVLVIKGEHGPSKIEFKKLIAKNKKKKIDVKYESWFSTIDESSNITR